MTADLEALITRLEESIDDELGPGRTDAHDAVMALRSQSERIAGLLDQHARDSAELRRLCDERDKAKREVKTWQDATGICNEINERMQIAAMEAGCPDETEVADWIIDSHRSKSAVIHALQKALTYWMPSVFDERSGHDAYLLVGYEGETESECWGDKAKERIQALEAKCAELERDAAWQPIETAPKDGTRVWAWFPFTSKAYAINWRENVYEQEANWTLDDGENATITFDAPTHWMPLPNAPIAAQDGSKEKS